MEHRFNINDLVYNEIAGGYCRIDEHMLNLANNNDEYRQLIRPIKIRDIMMQENGFAQGYGDTCGNEYLINKDKDNSANDRYYVNVVSIDNTAVCIERNSPIYVHEVQNLLRSAGMFQNADNFNISLYGTL